MVSFKFLRIQIFLPMSGTRGIEKGCFLKQFEFVLKMVM